MLITLSKYQSAIKQLPSHTLLAYLQEIIENKNYSIANEIYKSYIQKYIVRDVLPFFIAQIAQDTMLYSNPYRSLDKSKLKDHLYTIFKMSKEFYVDTMSINYTEDPIYDASSFMFRLGDTQSPFYEIPTKIGRTIILFLKLAKQEEGFDFSENFLRHFSVSIEESVYLSEPNRLTEFAEDVGRLNCRRGADDNEIAGSDSFRDFSAAARKSACGFGVGADGASSLFCSMTFCFSDGEVESECTKWLACVRIVLNGVSASKISASTISLVNRVA